MLQDGDDVALKLLLEEHRRDVDVLRTAEVQLLNLLITKEIHASGEGYVRAVLGIAHAHCDAGIVLAGTEQQAGVHAPFAERTLDEIAEVVRAHEAKERDFGSEGGCICGKNGRGTAQGHGAVVRDNLLPDFGEALNVIKNEVDVEFAKGDNVIAFCHTTNLAK